MFPLWFKIPGHHLISYKKAFSKTKKRHQQAAKRQFRYANPLAEVEKNRLRMALNLRFAEQKKINWPVQFVRVTIFFSTLFFAILFVEDVVKDAKVYNRDYELAVARVEAQKKQEAYEVLVHSGQIYLGKQGGQNLEESLRFSKAEFERALRLIPTGEAAQEGLAMALYELCTRFGTDCEGGEKKTNFKSPQ